jgi:DNA polymerase-3 subunit gamma/tau
LENFKNSAGAPDVLRKAIEAEFGIVVKFKPHMDASKQVEAPAPVAAPEPAPVAAQVSEPEDPEEPEEQEAPKSRNTAVDENARYGESLLREILGAEPIDE